MTSREIQLALEGEPHAPRRLYKTQEDGKKLELPDDVATSMTGSGDFFEQTPNYNLLLQQINVRLIGVPIFRQVGQVNFGETRKQKKFVVIGVPSLARGPPCRSAVMFPVCLST